MPFAIESTGLNSIVVEEILEHLERPISITTLDRTRAFF
jgi:hypothetical protein